MTIILPITAYTYACLMLLATIKLVSFVEHPIIFVINLTGIIFIFLYLINYRFLYLGLLILILAALLNGFFILNNITPTHQIIRFLFSALLFFINYWIHKN